MGFVFESEDGADGCLACGEDTWFNSEGLCWDCDPVQKAERKIDLDARCLLARAMGLSQANEQLRWLPTDMVEAKVAHLRTKRLILNARRIIRGA